MTQESIQLNTTPPYSGADLVADVNDALQSLGTDFAGPTDPAAVGGVGPYMTWADTANGLLKRRNAAGTAWVTIGKLLVDNSDAANIDYNNSAPGLAANDAQGAIDEIALKAGQLINVQIFTASGTYTPTTGTKKIIVEGVGGGGAGGGLPSTTAGQVGAGQGGQAGAYFKSFFTSGFAGVTVTIGAGGAGVAGASGGSGGTTSFGALASSPGGAGGQGGATFLFSSFPLSYAGSGIGPSPSGGNIVSQRGGEGEGVRALSVNFYKSGSGGASRFGSGAVGLENVFSGGNNASSPGSGGGGAVLPASSGTAAGGGSGASGIVIVWEYA